MSDAERLEALRQGLLERPMPETVAGRLLGLGFVQADPALRAQLEAVAASRPRHSFLPDRWDQPVAPARQIAKAHDLFAAWIADWPEEARLAPEERDPARIAEFIARLSAGIGKAPGQGDFRDHRLDRGARRARGLDLGAHAYTKRFRFLARFEAHLAQYERARRMAGWRLLGRAGLVADMPAARFLASPPAAAFIAYYAARRSLRSLFTSGAQPRAYDAVAAALLEQASLHPATDWGLVARIHPAPEVLARLGAAELGELLGAWTAALAGLSADLRACWGASRFDLDAMVVQRGDDSSTWNLLAQAWNTARAAWMALLEATGQQGLLEECCPGKVMKLMAADVAAWHRAEGGGLHADGEVWRALPPPWAVLRGERACPRAAVEQACRAAGLDPLASGWVAARRPQGPVPFTPTPELVHGIDVGAPGLALLLRKRGVFSGREPKPFPPGPFPMDGVAQR